MFFQSQSFWPDNASEWTVVLGATLTLLGAIFGLLIKQVRDKQVWENEVADIKNAFANKMKEHGERMGRNESARVSHESSITELRSVDNGHTYQISSIEREQGKSDGRLMEIDKNLRAHIDSASKLESKIKERMARTEERLKIPPEIN